LAWRVTRTYPFAQGRSAKHAARGGGGGDDEARSGADGVLFRLHHYLFLDAYPLVLLRAQQENKEHRRRRHKEEEQALRERPPLVVTSKRDLEGVTSYHRPCAGSR
jgi:hypothetical protein